MTTTSLPARPAGAQLRPRRSPRLMLLGLLLACVGALGAVAIYQAGTSSQTVLVAARTISRGEVIQAADLRVVDVTGAPGLSVVPADSMGEAVGQVALIDVGEGALLTPGSFGKASVAEGTVQLGLRLTPGRLPVRDMPAGTRVRLIAVQTKDATSGTGELVGVATVVTQPRETGDGAAFVLDVAVRADQGAAVAQLAASDRLVLVRES